MIKDFEFEYSEKEIKLLNHFDIDFMKFINPPAAFRLAVEVAFIRNEDGIYTDSLRRCIMAINACKIYRMTAEWDDLIQLD